MRRTASALALLVVAVTLAAAEPPPPAVGGPLPDFTLFDLEDRQYRLASFEEPVLVLNFWAFWCDTWIAQLPQLRELATQQEELGFQLLAVSVDGAWTDQVKALGGAEGLSFPVLLDHRSPVSRALRVRKVPTVVVVDRARKITYVHEAYPGNPAGLSAIRSAASAVNQPEPP